MESLDFTRKKEEKKTTTEWGSNVQGQLAGAGLDRHQRNLQTQSLRPSVPQSVPQSVSQYLHPSVPPSPSLSLSPSISPSISQSLRPPVCPSVPASLSPSVPPFLSPSPSPSVHPLVPLSPSLSLRPSLSPIHSHGQFRDELNRRSQTCLRSVNQKLDSPPDPGPDMRHKTLLPDPRPPD